LFEPQLAEFFSIRFGRKFSDFFNKPALKGDLGDLILETYRLTGKDSTIIALDKLKEMGFDMATKAGISIGIFDMIIPDEKKRPHHHCTKRDR